jgi:hypothetical protein
MATTYTPIATTTLSTTSSLVTFSSIPSTYTDLVAVISGRITTGVSYYQFKYNSDTGANYSRTGMTGTGSSATSEKYANETIGYPILTPLPTATSTFDISIVQIMNYTNTTTYKTYIGRGNDAGNNVTATVGLWRSTSAINRIDISPYASTFTSGSTFTLYGIKAA